MVVDRGYLDYTLYERWTTAGVWFVTRARTNMVYRVGERRAVPPRGPVLADQVIRLTSKHGRERRPSPLRRVVVWDAEHERPLVFLTNV